MKLNTTKPFKTVILILVLITGVLVFLVYCTQSFLSWIKTVPEDFSFVLQLVSMLILVAMFIVIFGLYSSHKEKIKEKISDSSWGKRLEISLATTLLLRRLSRDLWVIISLLFTWMFVEYFHILGVHSKSPEIVTIGISLWGLAIIADYLSKGAIYLSSMCSVPAGDYDNPYRLLGLFVGVTFTCLPLLI